MIGWGRRSGRARVRLALAGIIALAVSSMVPGGAASAQELLPPRATSMAVVLEVVWFSVGETQNVDVSSAFVGEVDSYTASSNNPAAVSVLVAGSVLSLTAVGPGIAYVEVSAVNAAGSASQWIGLVAQRARAAEEDSTEGAADSPTEGAADSPTEGAADSPTEDSAESSTEDSTDSPTEDSTESSEDQSSEAASESLLAITLSSRAYCAAERPGDVPGRDPGDADPTRDRNEVVRFAVNYTVIGGRGPYTVTSPHASNSASAVSEALQIACANRDPAGAASGYRLDTYDPVEVVIEVTDAAGNTASAEMAVELGLGTRKRNHGGDMRSIEPWVAGMERPEDNYVIATPSTSTLVTLVPNVDLRFVELSEDGVIHYADAGGGSEVWVNWATGTVVDTDVVVTDETYAHVFDITTVELTAAGLWPWEIPPQPDDAPVEEMEEGP